MQMEDGKKAEERTGW